MDINKNLVVNSFLTVDENVIVKKDFPTLTLKDVVPDAKSAVGYFVSWVRKNNIQLVQAVLGDNTTYKVSNVEKLFESLDKNKQEDFKELNNNEIDCTLPYRLGWIKSNISMQPSEFQTVLKNYVNVLNEAGVEELAFSKLDLVLESLKNQTVNNIHKTRQSFTVAEDSVINQIKPK